MKFHQRPEVWILLLGCFLAIGWVMLDSGGEADLGDESRLTLDPSEPLQLHRVTLERDYGNARLDLEFRYQNTSPRPLTFQPPDVRLVTAAGVEVPPFILPVEPPPSVAAGATQDLRLRYWLDSAHLEESLTLWVRDASLLVKADAPLNLERLDNAKPRSWTSADWKL